MSAAQPPPQPPPYIVAGAAAPGRRVRAIGPAGAEEHAADNPWLQMRLNADGAADGANDDAAAAADAAEKAAGGGGGGGGDGDDSDAEMRPEEVVEAFACARVRKSAFSLGSGRALQGRAQQHGAWKEAVLISSRWDVVRHPVT